MQYMHESLVYSPIASAHLSRSAWFDRLDYLFYHPFRLDITRARTAHEYRSIFRLIDSRIKCLPSIRRNQMRQSVYSTKFPHSFEDERLYFMHFPSLINQSKFPVITKHNYRRNMHGCREKKRGGRAFLFFTWLVCVWESFYSNCNGSRSNPDKVLWPQYTQTQLTDRARKVTLRLPVAFQGAVRLTKNKGGKKWTTNHKNPKRHADPEWASQAKTGAMASHMHRSFYAVA